MKFLKHIVSVFFFCGLFLQLQGQSLERILEKHYEAHSQEIWDQINTLSADVEWHGPQGTIIGGVLAKKPTYFYLSSRKSRVIEAFDGTESWSRAPWLKDQTLTIVNERSQTLPFIVDFGSPISKDEELIYKGKVQVDNRNCHWIVNEVQKMEYFVEVRNHRFYKSIVTLVRENQELQLTKTVTTYRTFNGILAATVVEMKTPNSTSEYVFDNILLGEGILTSRFKKPNG